MGKLNVAILRYLTPEDFRVLTAVSMKVLELLAHEQIHWKMNYDSWNCWAKYYYS